MLIRYYVNGSFMPYLSAFFLILCVIPGIYIDRYLRCLSEFLIGDTFCLIIGKIILGWDQYFVVTRKYLIKEICYLIAHNLLLIFALHKLSALEVKKLLCLQACSEPICNCIYYNWVFLLV